MHVNKRAMSGLLSVAILLGGLSSVAQGTEPEGAASTVAALPPMGWNSWNHFGDAVNEADVKAAAKALVTSGMAAAGYKYVIVDDGWQGKRNAKGELEPNAKFPHIRKLIAYVHRLGLKFGIYSSPGPRTCAGNAGSEGHVLQDAREFASWGVDYVKYDLCSYRARLAGQTLQKQRQIMRAAYAEMGNALRATGRPIVYSLCQYGWGNVWEWGASVDGNLWRISNDIRPSYESMWFNAESDSGLGKWAGPGHWNDPDMLEIGNKGFDDVNEERSEMSLWSLLAAPLIAGNDPAAMSPATRAVLTNRAAIAIDQDSLGKQGKMVEHVGSLQVWARPLSGGRVAVGLFNMLNHPQLATLDLSKLGVRGPVTASDVWANKEIDNLTSAHEFAIPTHGVVLLVMPARRLSAIARKR